MGIHVNPRQAPTNALIRVGPDMTGVSMNGVRRVVMLEMDQTIARAERVP